MPNKATKTKKSTKHVKRAKKISKKRSDINGVDQMKLWCSIGKAMTIPATSDVCPEPYDTEAKYKIMDEKRATLEKVATNKLPCLTPSINRWLLEYNEVVSKKAPAVNCNYNEILGVADTFGIPVSNMKNFLEFAIKIQSIDVDAVMKLNSTLKKTIYALREIKLKQAKETAEAEAGVVYTPE